MQGHTQHARSSDCMLPFCNDLNVCLSPEDLSFNRYIENRRPRSDL